MNMKHLYTTLGSGVTSGSVTDNSITNDSVIEIYFDDNDCYVDSTSQSGHTVYFTVGGNATGVNVCVVVNNLTNFVPYDDTDIRERVAETEQDIINLETIVDELATTVDALETTIDGLNASNISYDEQSTLYSAMGDIDELETTSKNLVGAINENFTYVSSGKSLVASAITDKGVPTESDATFETMANNISQISGGGSSHYLGCLPLDRDILEYIPNFNKDSAFVFRRTRNGAFQYIFVWYRPTTNIVNWNDDGQSSIRPSNTSISFYWCSGTYNEDTKALTLGSTTYTSTFFGIDNGTSIRALYCKGITYGRAQIY